MTQRTMDTLLKPGRCFFAASLIAFGVQYVIYGRFAGGLPPVPPWTPGGHVGAYLVGAALIAAGIRLQRTGRLAGQRLWWASSICCASYFCTQSTFPT